MKKKQLIILIVLLVFGLIQFIRPDRNLQTNPSRYDIFHKTETNPEVVMIVQQACYDCHSNRTAYPWYASIAPVSWMISQHVKDGKKHLNFSEWTLYSAEKQSHKLDEIVEVLQENEMPPQPYVWLHKEAAISPAKKERLMEWLNQLQQGNVLK